MSQRLAFFSILTVLVWADRAETAEFDPNVHPAWYNQSVSVLMKDGRTPRGILSPASNGTHLVIRRDEPGISLESRFRWSQVEAMRPMTVSTNILPAAGSVTLPPSPCPGGGGSDGCPDPTVMPCDAPVNQCPIPNPPTPPEEALMPGDAIPPGPAATWLRISPTSVASSEHVSVVIDPIHLVRSLTIEATTANWDRDAEVDGLLVRVRPLNGLGQAVPLEGQLDLDLMGEAIDSLGGQSSGWFESFGLLERWTIPVRLTDFDPAGVLLQVPFRRFHPERQVNVAQMGMIFGKLHVPGVGRVDAANSQVVLRPSSRFRDDLQLRERMRQFPFEHSQSSVGNFTAAVP